jgi:hypothetical protein
LSKNIDVLLNESLILLNESSGVGKNTGKYLRNYVTRRFENPNPDVLGLDKLDTLSYDFDKKYENNTKKIAELKKKFNKTNNPIKRNDIKEQVKSLLEKNKKMKLLSKTALTKKEFTTKDDLSDNSIRYLNNKSKYTNKEVKDILKK